MSPAEANAARLAASTQTARSAEPEPCRCWAVGLHDHGSTSAHCCMKPPGTCHTADGHAILGTILGPSS